MAVQENLTVPHHQQDTDNYCGSACAQMVLDSINAGLLDQDDLFTDSRNNHGAGELSSWATPPDGLQWVMNDRRPVGFGGWFALYALNTKDAISRKIVWTIHHYQVAPIALVLNGDHWIVVHGYNASAAPSSSTDNSYTINSFDFNDPSPPVPTPPVPPPPPPPPHGGNDGCGTGGVRGIANQNISYSTWKSFYMTGNKWGSQWNGKNVAVCDPDPPPEKHGKESPPVRRLKGDRLLSGREAVKYAVKGLEDYGLLKRDSWREIIEIARPVDPVLVHRLDKIDSYYYIVPFKNREQIQNREHINIAAVSINARFGDYHQSIILPKGGSSIITAMDKNKIYELIVGRRLPLERFHGRIRIRKESFCLYPSLVWLPCLESLSPFYPFHMITVGDNRIYIRVDGQIFTKLHTTNVGGI